MMPTRRTFELVIITVILAQPALAVVRLWLKKHVATTSPGIGSDVARAGVEIL
jgi:hypothetical protein